jgi:ABC-type transport system involved in multi-copper enzyme maturation permease subunit
MSPLIKKEIRLLLPAWGVAMFLTIVPAMLMAVLWMPATRYERGFLDYAANLVPLTFALGVLPLGLASFGQEFSSGTFTVLLAQPAERLRIWRTKISILALAFLSVWLVAVILSLCQYYYFSFGMGLSVADIREYREIAPMYFTLATLVAFSGGLWSTLLLRQVATAFWFTLLFPIGIVLGISSLLSFWMDAGQNINRPIDLALLAYSILGFFIARKLFLRSQDVQWTGGDIIFPWQGKVSETATSRAPRPWLFALVWKEIQLHQVNILIAIVLLVMSLTSYVALKLHPHFENPNLQFVFETVWVLWLLMPLLIGAAAVSEERRMGVLESQLCLPISRRTLFFVKFSTALLLSLFLGGLMPLLLKVDAELNGWIFAVAAAIFWVSFYTSSFARTVLQAIGLSFVIVAAIYLYLVITTIGALKPGLANNSNPIGLALLKLYLGGPILALVLAGMAFWNFKWLHQYAKCFRRNAVAVVCAFVFIFILINSIYFRAWEYLSPIEPSAEPARLQNPTALKFSFALNTLYARLPNGRVWIDTLAMDYVSNHWQQADVLVPDRSHTHFLEGTDWADVTADNFQALGIKSDGTLWSLQRKWNPAQNRWFQTNPFTITQIGSNTDWSQAASCNMGFLLLKKDGSLWLWGIQDYDWRGSNSIPRKFKLDLATSPERVGNETDWTMLFPTGGVGDTPQAMKNDGSVWRWEGPTGTFSYFSHAMVRETDLAGPWVKLVYLANLSYVGIQTNGSLWVTRDVGSSAWGQKERQVKAQWEKDTRWKSVGGNWNAVYAIRSDGTLWKWSPIWNLPDPPDPVQLGNRSDWVSLDMSWSGNFSIAADGSLWAWDQPSRHIWLAPSRKPLYLGNILDGASANQ